MIVRKPIASLSSCTHIHYASGTHSFASHPLHPPFNRTYATVIEDARPSDQDDLAWPRSRIPHVLPTPYEILKLKRNSPYSKHRFYQLVKIYHPDRRGHTTFSSHISGLPGHVIQERYRLIVTAHEILSDPVKRKAYDKYGTGWTSHITTQPRAWSSERAGKPYVWPRERKWSGFHANDSPFARGSPFANATWEDWERWYGEGPAQAGGRQAPLYTSNGTFFTLVLSAVLAGAVGQRMMVQEHDALFQNQAKMAHEQAAECYREMMAKTRSFEDNHARMGEVLKKREKGRPPGVSDKDFRKGLNDDEEEVGIDEDIDDEDSRDSDQQQTANG